MTGFLTPCKDVHCQTSKVVDYHKKEKEMVNYHHSSWRIVIEHRFGVWKALWLILEHLVSFPFETQRLSLVASMAIHSFLRKNAIADKEF